MLKTRRDRDAGPALFDIGSYARRGPSERFSPQELEAIALTVRRTPEVMVKVSGAATSTRGALAHLKYIDRAGDLAIQTDRGEVLQGEGAESDLAADWDLELLAATTRSPYQGRAGRKAQKLVHNVVLSMPAGTSPTKLLAASRSFARETFALQHRYAMVLHTDQDHPHVHLVVKAVSEEGKRLNIHKATLRDWRRQFAALLRAQGIPANATERAVRGQVRGPVRDPIYRANLRGESRHRERQVQEALHSPAAGRDFPEPGSMRLKETRSAVVKGWNAIADQLLVEGHAQLAQQVWKLIGGMPAPQTDAERLRARLVTPVDRDRRVERTR